MLFQQSANLSRTIAATILFTILLSNTTVFGQSSDTSTSPSATDTTIEAEDAFPDVPVGSQYYVGIKYLKDLDLIHGYSDGLYRPKQHINRAEALKILVGAINYNQFSIIERPIASLEASPDITSEETCPFPDLEKTAWYFEYVCNAYANNIIDGYPDGTFKPEQTINKVEALKITILQGGIPLETTYTDNFDDISPSDWFWDYARIANEKSFIVEDRSGNLTPGENLSRGDFAMLVYRTMKAIKNGSEFGRATYYGGRFEGQSTANGETFQGHLPTAAHKTLPFNTIVRVTNLANGKQIDVRINDRGPYVNGTIIDLSTMAFDEIASLSSGVIHTEVEIISTP